MDLKKRSHPGLFYRLISVLLAALVFINCSLVSSVSQNIPASPDASTPTPEPTKPNFVPSPELPPPPAPMNVSLQDPDQAASQLASDLAGKAGSLAGVVPGAGHPRDWHRSQSP